MMDTEARTAWFEEARFGMFIHFGLYSLPAGIWNGVPMGRNRYAEWIQMQGNWPHGIPADAYRALAARFDPVRFDADAWINELALAGMRYLVITSKHHDGFALWPSRVSAYNVVDATPFGRDILGELKTACDKRGVRFGLYYSHWLDWDHPHGGRPHKEEFHSEPVWEQPSDSDFEIYWQEKCLPQVRELIDRYDPCLFWFDTWAQNSSDLIHAGRIDELIGLIRAKSPNCLVNSRIGAWGHPKENEVVDFLSMGDNQFPTERIAQPWETSGTMNESWGYHQSDFAWKPSRVQIAHLISNTARGGNFQLNVGPLADGSFPRAAVRRLREIGAWLAANGESIYGTFPDPAGPQPFGEITTRHLPGGVTRRYLHCLSATPGEPLILPPQRENPASAFVLETGQTVEITESPKGTALLLPSELNDEILFGVPVIAVDYPEAA